MLLALSIQITVMKNKNIITVAAAVAAGVTTYFIWKKISDNRQGKSEPASGRGSRHITNAFAKAKSAATGQAGTP
jgi:hypothetical protein